mgnify:CR=1 FL=1
MKINSTWMVMMTAHTTGMTLEEIKFFSFKEVARRMVWGGFRDRGKANLAFLTSHMDTMNYQTFLEEHLLYLLQIELKQRIGYFSRTIHQSTLPDAQRIGFITNVFI